MKEYVKYFSYLNGAKDYVDMIRSYYPKCSVLIKSEYLDIDLQEKKFYAVYVRVYEEVNNEEDSEN